MMATTPDTLTTVTRADHVAGPPQGQWTVDDLDALPADGFQYFILDGVLYMAPPPVPAHQRASRWLVYYLTEHVQQAGLGAVYSAPIRLALGAGTDPEPDLVVIRKGNRRVTIGPTRISGVPDLVIEVASPSTAAFDRDDQTGKQAMYARAGISEYWLVDPDEQTIEVLTLIEGAYQSLGTFRGNDRLPSPVAPLPVPVAAFFVADDL